MFEFGFNSVVKKILHIKKKKTFRSHSDKFVSKILVYILYKNNMIYLEDVVSLSAWYIGIQSTRK